MIVVTGSQLPLGSYIAQALITQGYTVHRVRRAMSLNHAVGIRTSVDAVVHADTHLHSARPRTAVDNNILGTRAVRSFALRHDVPVIYLSSIVAQGPCKAGPHSTVSPTDPRGVIARSLDMSERLLIKKDVDADIFRLAVPYGFDGSFDRLCKGLKRSILRPLLGDIQLSFIHLDDVLSAIIQRLQTRDSVPFFGHLSDGVDRTGEDLLNALERNGNIALRVPLDVPRLFWRITDRVSTPFGNWDMIGHLSHGSTWTSRSDRAEASFGFAPKMSWPKHINTLS